LETKLLVGRTATLLTLALLAATAIGVAAATIVVYVSAPGFAATPAKFDLTVAMLRITFPYICSSLWSRSPAASSIPGAVSPYRRSLRLC